MLNSRTPSTQGEEENISPSLGISEVNFDQSSIPNFNPTEISLKNFHVTDTEYPIAELTFIIKDKEIVRRITLCGLLGAIDYYFDNSVSAKTVHNTL